MCLRTGRLAAERGQGYFSVARVMHVAPHVRHIKSAAMATGLALILRLDSLGVAGVACQCGHICTASTAVDHAHSCKHDNGKYGTHTEVERTLQSIISSIGGTYRTGRQNENVPAPGYIMDIVVRGLPTMLPGTRLLIDQTIAYPCTEGSLQSGSAVVASSAAVAAEKGKITKYGHLLIPGDTLLPAAFETFGSTTPSFVLWFEALAKRVTEARYGPQATQRQINYLVAQWRQLIALALFEGLAAHMAAFHDRLPEGRAGTRAVAAQDVWAVRWRGRGGAGG